jgi:hypothetical protein
MKTSKPSNQVEILIWCQKELRRVEYYLARAAAPKTAAKLRSTLKSLDGAIRHAERMRARNAAQLTWSKARVGEHWSSNVGNFTISTYGVGIESGFELKRTREPIGRYQTWSDAAAAAENAREVTE